MSLESFMGFDASEGMSAASLEQLRKKMKAASAQIAAIRKEEGKQKKQEDRLLKILLQFVKSSHKTDLVLLISRALQENIPANFILAIVLLSNPEIKAAVGQFLLIGGGLEEIDEPTAEDQSLVFFREDETLPLKVKIELDNWMKSLLLQAEENPQKILKTAYKVEMIPQPKEYEFEETKYDKKETVKEALVRLMAFVLREYLEQKNLPENYEKLADFSEFILNGILTKTRENYENRHMLGSETADI